MLEDRAYSHKKKLIFLWILNPEGHLNSKFKSYSNFADMGGFGLLVELHWEG